MLSEELSPSLLFGGSSGCFPFPLFFVDVDVFTGGLRDGFIRSEGREEFFFDHGVPFIPCIFEAIQR